ncbi:trypsin-like peptidase domain-containing protein [Microbacterium sp. NPDC096154]|uniref:S1C family serine protease n=1 Tax=Microbacterium sp. NPDC096154 TaxID=3155549 RepID=UPI0033238A95
MDTQRSDENDAPRTDAAQAGFPQDPQTAGEYRAPQDFHIPPRPPAPQGAFAPPYGSMTPPPAGAHGQAAPGHAQGYAVQGAHGQAFGPAASHTEPTQPLPHEYRVAAPEEPAKKRDRRGGRAAALLVAAALVGGLSGLGGSYAGEQWFGDAGTVGTATGPSNITVNNPGSVNEATAVATEVLPSVVTIEVSGGQQAGSGSGVVVSDDGYVVTNTHVVTLGGATADPDIRVTTSNGTIYRAEVVGTDPIYDLAVIKLQDAQGLTPIEFADSSKLNVGDTTAAVGAPLGLSNTVTTGIVSALNRSIEIASSAAPDSGDEAQPSPEEEQQSPFRFDNGLPQQSVPSESISIAVIQTDAAINHGNSGGALVDSQGRLIGINVAIASAGGEEESGSIGVGFAIPSNVVKRVSDELIADGVATHGLLGASVQPASVDENATTAGALIADVTAGGAAEKAGLREGDIVTEFNGVRIGSAVDLTAQVRAAAGGSDATLTYVRDGQSRTLDVTLGELQQ